MITSVSRTKDPRLENAREHNTVNPLAYHDVGELGTGVLLLQSRDSEIKVARMPVQCKGCERNIVQKLHAFMFNSVHKNTCKVVKKQKK